MDISRIVTSKIYFSLAAFLAVTVLLSLYRSRRVLMLYTILVAGAIAFHIFVLKTITFDSPKRED